jgi:hypothetical protein
MTTAATPLRAQLTNTGLTGRTNSIDHIPGA